MKFSREFIELNLLFAQLAERVKGIPRDEALLNYTHLYLALGLGRDFDATNPVWRDYLNGLQTGQDFVDLTFKFYLKRQARLPKKVAQPAFGCFYYAVWPVNRVRLHFHNAETNDQSPLSLERQPQRSAELAAMFRHLKHDVPSIATVVGGSWLYNVEAYRRLFPPSFLETAQIGEGEYQFIALWGQFLDHFGEVKPEMAQRFLDRLGTVASEDRLQNCFPYQALRLECAIDSFYEFYEID